MEIIIIVVVIMLFVGLKLLRDSNNMEKQIQENPSPKISFTISGGLSEEGKETDNLTSFTDIFENVKYLPLEISKNLRIKYKSGRNEHTEREIDILELGLAYNDDIMIEAYCHLRNQERSFYVGRMLEIIDLDTGEVIVDRKSFFKKLIDDYLKSPEYQETLEKIQRYEFTEDFKETYNDILVIMGYIVRVDGSFNQKEREIVYEYIHKLNDSPLLDENSMKRIMKEYGVVSYASFQNRVRKLGENPPFDLIEFTEKIIATQKTISDAEQKALNYLKKRFGPKEVKIKKTPIPKEPNKECPHCGSGNTRKKGKRKFKNHVNQNYLCKECGKIFSEKIEVI